MPLEEREEAEVVRRRKEKQLRLEEDLRRTLAEWEHRHGPWVRGGLQKCTHLHTYVHTYIHTRTHTHTHTLISIIHYVLIFVEFKAERQQGKLPLGKEGGFPSFSGCHGTWVTYM